MAVTTDKMKSRFKVKYPLVNLSTKRLDELMAKLAKKPADDADDAAIDAFLEEMNDVLDFAGIAKEDDRVRNLEKLAEKPKPADEPEKPADVPKPSDNTTEALLAKLTESVKSLTGEVKAMKEGKVLDDKKQTAIQAIEASEVFKNLKPEQRQKWANRIDLTSEVSFEDQVKEFETELTDLRQETANNGNYSGIPPKSGGNSGEPSEKEVEAIVENL